MKDRRKKLTIHEAREIRQINEDFPNTGVKWLAREFCVGVGTISRVINNEAYREEDYDGEDEE